MVVVVVVVVAVVVVVVVAVVVVVVGGLVVVGPPTSFQLLEVATCSFSFLTSFQITTGCPVCIFRTASNLIWNTKQI